jgi:hypothetical protein
MGVKIMAEWEIKNAVIERVQLGYEDHGIPTCWLFLKYDGCGQGFGGWDLRWYGIDFILKILSTLSVNNWEELEGKPCRANASHGKVKAIGHYLEDKWFEPEKDLIKKE